MKKREKMRRSRLLAGVLCISLFMADLVSAVPAWAKEPAAAEQTQGFGETLNTDEEDGESRVQSPDGEDTGDNAQEQNHEDGNDGDGTRNPDAGNDGDDAQNPDGGKDGDNGQNPGGETDDGDVTEDSELSEDEKTDGEDGNEAANPDGVTDDAEEEPETPDGEDGDQDDAPDEDGTDKTPEEDETGDPEETVSVSDNSISENDMEARGELFALAVPEDAIASGTYGNITWVIDADGKLTVEGTGDFAEPSTDPDNESAARNRVPWRSYVSKIKTAQINVTGMTDASYMFSGCTALASVDLSGFDTGKVKNMCSMFSNCSSLKNLDLSGFDTGNVTNMWSVFSGCRSLESLDVSSFDTGRVTNMQGMFNGCSGLKSLDVSGFDTSNVENMSQMFGYLNLESLDVGRLNTSGVTRMDYMFSNCNRITELNLSNFNTANVKSMEGLFQSSYSLTKLDITSFDTGNVESMRYMFNGCSKLAGLDLSHFNTAKVTDMDGMFSNCSGLLDLNVNGFDTRNVTTMHNMFSRCSNLENLDVSSFNTGSVRCMIGMFSGCSKLLFLDLHSFDTSGIPAAASGVTGLDDMFQDCSSLTSLDISGFDVSGTTSLNGMFERCVKLSHLDLSNFDTSNISDMRDLFSGCSSLTELDLRGFDTANVTRMDNMFYNCSSLKTLDLHGFRTGKVVNMDNMFRECKALTDLDITGLNTAEVTSMRNMFYNCHSLEALDVSSFDTGKVENMESMFNGCSSLTGLDLSSFDLGAVPYHRYLAFLGGCNKLEIIYTPYNVAANSRLTLPTATGSVGDNVWYRSDNKEEITTLPEGLDHSILVTRDKIPEVAARITARKTKTAYACGDEIALDDLTVTHYGADGSVRKLAEGQYTTNVEELNRTMTEAGEKKLVVTYQDREAALTAEITLTVTYGLSLSTTTITLPAEEDYSYTYDGTPKTPAPTAVTYTKPSAESTGTPVTLAEGTDYTVSYRNNINAYEETGTDGGTGTDVAGDDSGAAGGSAGTEGGTDTAAAAGGSTSAPTVIIRGMGKYSGMAEKVFAIHKADAPAAQTLEVTASQCTQVQSKRVADLTAGFAECGEKTGYEIISVDDPKNIFSKTPVTADIKNGILTYGTNAAQENDIGVIKIKVSFANYKDAELTLKITMVSKKAALISGIAMQDIVYSGMPVSSSGTAVVNTEDGTDITGQVTLVYRYSGTMADGTAYPVGGTGANNTAGGTAENGAPDGIEADQGSGNMTEEAPVNAGNYVLTVSVKEDDPDYVGSAAYPFVITQADAVVKAKDITVLMQTTQAEGSALVPVGQYQDSFGYEAAGLLNADTLRTEPVYTVTEDEAGTKPVTAVDTSKEGVYYIHPSGADAGMNYKIAYKPGILMVSEEGVAYTVTFDGMGRCDTFTKGGVKAGSLLELTESERKPAAKEQGYVFAGWYQDRAFAKGTEWHFDTDTVQSDLTLYACWLTAAQDGNGLKLCVQEIPDLTYTGSAQKPVVTVYDSDGTTFLKEGKDYTLKYVRNTDAVAVGGDGEPTVAGGTARVTNPGKANEQITDVIGKFSKDCPYVAITGKGNYAETIYRNFMILPADIAAEGDAAGAGLGKTPAGNADDAGNTQLAAGFTLKYTDQFEAKAGRTAKIVASLKYKKALKEGKDYTVSVTDGSGQDVKLEKGKLPLDAGSYVLTVTGKGNYTGAVRRNLYVAEKQKLMKNISIVLGKNQKKRAYTGEDVVLTPGYYDASAKKNYKVTAEGVVDSTPEANADDIFLVKAGKEGLVWGKDYTIDYAGTNRAAGTATMTLTGKNGYVGSKSVTFRIMGAPFNAKTVDVKMYDDAKPGEPQADAFRDTMTYTGKAVTQNKVTLTAKAAQDNPTARELTYGEHYTITYRNHVKKGTATMTFTAKPESGYSGSFKKTFKITAQDLVKERLTVNTQGETVNAQDGGSTTAQTGNIDANAVYSKNGAKLSFTITNEAGAELREGTDYTVKYKNNNAITTAQTAENKKPLMTVTGKGNYAGKVEVSFTIIPIPLASAMDGGSVSVSCAQVQKKNGMQFKDFKFKLVEGKKALGMGESKDYVIDETGCTPQIIQTYADALAVAEASTGTDVSAVGTSLPQEPAVKVTGRGSYTGGQSVEIPLGKYIYVEKLTAASLYVVVSEKAGQNIYTGRQVTPDVAVYYGEKTAVSAAKKDKVTAEAELTAENGKYKLKKLAAGDDYTLSYGANTAAGKNKGSVTVTGAGRYGGSVTVKFTIERKAIY